MLPAPAAGSLCYRFAMPHFALTDCRIHYRCAGRGSTLLLVHGLGSSGADWAFQVDALAPHFRLVMPDLRGSGLSDAPAGPYSIARFASDLWALLDHLGEPRTHLLGFSLGGAVATEMALQRPAAVERLMTINSLPSYRVDHWRKWLEVHAQRVLVRTLGLRRTAMLVARRLFPMPHQAAMRERVVQVLGGASKQAYLDSAQALVGWCAMARTSALRMPLLMLAAELDYTPLEEKRGFARRLGAELAVIAGSRHGTAFDAIAATNACALAFFQGLPLPGADMLRIDAVDRVPTQAPVEFGTA
jgi:3-oxoadipate enol-lactonase